MSNEQRLGCPKCGAEPPDISVGFMEEAWYVVTAFDENGGVEDFNGPHHGETVNEIGYHCDECSHEFQMPLPVESRMVEVEVLVAYTNGTWEAQEVEIPHHLAHMGNDPIEQYVASKYFNNPDTPEGVAYIGIYSRP